MERTFGVGRYGPARRGASFGRQSGRARVKGLPHRIQTFLNHGSRVFGAGSNPIGIRAHNDLVRVWASHPRIGGGAGCWCRLSRKWRVVGCASSWRRCRMGKEEINQHLFKKEVTDPLVCRPRTTSMRRNGCPSYHRVRVLASRH